MSMSNIPDTPVKSALIVGAGLAGSLMALFLAQRGYHVTVFEYRPDPCQASASSSTSARLRSINLALSTRGLTALKAAGVDQLIAAAGIPMKGRMIHPRYGSTQFQQYGQEEDHLLSVSRAELNIRLLQQCREMYPKQIQFHFGYKCVKADLDKGIVDFENTATVQGHTPEIVSKTAGLILGADGAFSKIRAAMMKKSRFNYAQYYLNAGYKELAIPSGPNNSFLMHTNSLHIWPRNSYMLIALPNLDGSFTCTLFMDHEGEISFSKISQSEETLLEFFRTNFPDTLDLMPTLVEDFFENPTPSLVTVRCEPYHYKNFVLIGDAAHALVPFYGQGINAGFEDCRILAELLDKYDGDLKQVLPDYTQERKPNGDAISDLALENYVVMAKKTADPLFVVRRKVELLLNKLIPQYFKPLYSMVSFSNIPYKEAVDRAHNQDLIISRAGLGLGLIGMASVACVILGKHIKST